MLDYGKQKKTSITQENFIIRARYLIPTMKYNFLLKNLSQNPFKVLYIQGTIYDIISP